MPYSFQSFLGKVCRDAPKGVCGAPTTPEQIGMPGRETCWRFPEDVFAQFQPIFSTTRNRIVGIEALARVRLQSGQVLAPYQFLPFLHAQQRRELSRMMLLEGIRVLEILEAEGIQIDLSFNVDPDFMEDADCTPCFLGVMKGTPIKPERITLELLESGDFLNGEIVTERLQALRETGAHIALDDIGSAYSSLLRLKNLPISKIKLDQELVRDLDRDPKILSFIQSIKFLADGLGATLIVEGVETPSILDAVFQLRQDLVQGFAIAKPLDFPELLDMIRRGSAGILPTLSEEPISLLGAYAAHVLRRPLLYSLSHGGKDFSLANFIELCPLVQFLREHPCPEGQEILAAYCRLLQDGNKLGAVACQERIQQTEQEVQRILLAAMHPAYNAS